jgi:N-acetyl-anhydromuramyl-L-alanine amidase AmpD
MTVKVVQRPSPNQSTRVHGNDAVRLVICHTPEGSYQSAIATCLNDAADVSYHELVREDGLEVTQFVHFSRKAWHAGAMNSFSDGISAAGWARDFDVHTRQARTFAYRVALRLHARKLPARWTTDPAKGGVCRHSDLQDDRSDPTPDLAEWRVFVGMVAEELEALQQPPPSRPWPIPIPKWFWAWARWHLGRRKGKRPADAPRVIPVWAWRRLRELQQARK